MRILVSLIVLLIGFGLAGLPWFSESYLGEEIGSFEVYDAAAGSRPAAVDLQPEQAPLSIIVDVSVVGRMSSGGDVVLTLTVAHGGGTVLTTPLTFADSEARDLNPQTGERMLSQTAGTLPSLEPGRYTFTVNADAPGRAAIKRAELRLKRSGAIDDGRLQPIGFALLAVGFIGLVLSLRGRRAPTNPNSQPPARRWGRTGNSP